MFIFDKPSKVLGLLFGWVLTVGLLTELLTGIKLQLLLWSQGWLGWLLAVNINVHNWLRGLCLYLCLTLPPTGIKELIGILGDGLNRMGSGLAEKNWVDGEIVVLVGFSFSEDIGPLVSGKIEFWIKETSTFVIGFTGTFLGGSGITEGRDGETTGTLVATLECSEWKNTGGALDGSVRVVVGLNVLIWFRPGKKVLGWGGGGGLTATDGRKEFVWGRSVEVSTGRKGWKGLVRFGMILVGLAGVLTRKMFGSWWWSVMLPTWSLSEPPVPWRKWGDWMLEANNCLSLLVVTLNISTLLSSLHFPNCVVRGVVTSVGRPDSDAKNAIWLCDCGCGCGVVLDPICLVTSIQTWPCVSALTLVLFTV